MFLNRLKQDGVTLLELVIVIVVMGMLTVPIASGFKTVGQGFGLNRELQMSAGIAQECAEYVLSQARIGNYASIGSATCDILPAIPNFPEFSTLVRNLSVVNVTSAVEVACPSSENCKSVIVSVTVKGVIRSEINFLVIN